MLQDSGGAAEGARHRGVEGPTHRGGEGPTHPQGRGEGPTHRGEGHAAWGVSDEDLTDGPEWDGDTGDLDEDPDLWLTPGGRLAKVSPSDESLIVCLSRPQLGQTRPSCETCPRRRDCSDDRPHYRPLYRPFFTLSWVDDSVCADCTISGGA